MVNLYKQKTAQSPTLAISEYFSSGKSEEISPFLTSDSREWAKNLPLKISVLAALVLLAAFILSFFDNLKHLSGFLQVTVYFAVGVPALIDAAYEVKKVKVNIDVLMVLAAFLAIFIHSSLEGCLLLVLFSFSHSLETFVTNKAKSTLNHLNQLAPTTALVFNKYGKTTEKSVKDVNVGETIFVRQGEIIPLDGKVIDGTSSLNVSHLTGEHIPISVDLGYEVPAGALNLDGSLKIEVTKTGSHSTISRIIQLICEAHVTKPKLQSWFDRFSQIYSLFVIFSSLFFAIFIPIFFSKLTYFGIEGSIYRALAYLIVASPCALIIAVPVAYISAINSCAKQGVILKGGLTLDTLAKVDAIAFDKTGTLTSGELECVQIQTLDGAEITDQNKVLSIAKGLEEHAVHPVAKAILDYADYREIEAAEILKAHAIPGQGIEGQARYNNQTVNVAIGRLDFVSQRLKPELKSQLDSFKNELSNLITALKIDDEIYIFQFVDHLRPEAQKILKTLKKSLKLKVYILSGDNDLSVEKIAKNLDVDQYFGHLKPDDKLKLIDEYSKEQCLAMVGDGINDTPALARAAIGISMGHIGSHMGTEVAEVILIKNDLTLIEKLLKKAKDTNSIVKQNVILASAIIAGISIPALLGWIPLWLAVICHEGGTVLVGLNGLRLLKNK